MTESKTDAVSLVDRLNALPPPPPPAAASPPQRIVEAHPVGDADLEKINTTSAMRWLDVTYADGTAERLVLKDASGARGKALGLAREGLFYAHWPTLFVAAAADDDDADDDHSVVVQQIANLLPRVVRSAADMDTGAKTLLMEDMSACVQAGYFFGPHNPNNWGIKDLVAAQRGFELTPAQITAMAGSVAAKLHAATWNRTTLRDPDATPSWLRGAGWLTGRDRASWEASQQSMADYWAGIQAQRKDGACGVSFSDRLARCLDAAVAKIDWDAFQAELADRPFCLVHGDFHPANFMVRPKNAVGQHTLALLDWEMVGVGSGPQDLGQFMVSHFAGDDRAALERGAVEAYFAELTSLNPSIKMTLEECWAEYVEGALGRFLWFVPMLVSLCPPTMGQFFVDIVEHFVETHGVTPETVPMPRV